jgi:hypothetical protein
VLTVLGSYKSMGGFTGGITTRTLPLYTMLGEESNSTVNLIYDAYLNAWERTSHGFEQGRRSPAVQKATANEERVGWALEYARLAARRKR